jgi:glycosyltransferase involved in cell wall biosynthesis
MIDIILPVRNEEKDLIKNVTTLYNFLNKNMLLSWRILICESGSTDATYSIAKQLSSEYTGVDCLHFDKPGRGYALRTAWENSTADIVSYMDLDLSTDIKFFPELITSLTKEGYDIAIGSRKMSSSVTKRSLKRKFLSMGYNLIIKMMGISKISDFQCGFKAIKREVAQEVLPKVKDELGFFDTEFLVLAERQGYKIKELPVNWIEDSESSFTIHGMINNMFLGLARLRLLTILQRRGGWKTKDDKCKHNHTY